MKIFKKYKNKKAELKKREELPLIARVNLSELMAEREAEGYNREKSILASIKRNYIRLVYIYLEKYNSRMDGQNKIGITWGTSGAFLLPVRMSIEEASKIVSYVSEQVEREYNLEPASIKSVEKTAEVLQKYGFKLDDKEFCRHHQTSEYHMGEVYTMLPRELNYTDLFTIDGDFKLFKRTQEYDRYFDWFTKVVTKEEVEEICNKYFITMPNSQVQNER